MQNPEIKINKIYAMKIGKNTVGIRIMSQNEDGSWVGVNVNTNKEVVIKSTDRFCGLYNPKPAKKTPKSAVAKKEHVEPSGDTTQAKERKQGGLGAAAKVLEEAATPLRCKDMVKVMLAQGLWKTDGKTPEATIYSAIIREIKEKGADSRFRKTARGMFELNK